MMHIAFITTEYPHPSFSPAGGIGSFVKLMAKSLTKLNHKVTVFLCLSNNNKVWYDDEIRIVEMQAVSPSILSPFKNRFKFNTVIKKYISKDKIDIIEAPDWEGMHAFCNFKIPLITRIHGSVTYFNFLQGIKKPRLLYYLEKKAIKKSQYVIAVSNFSGELTEKVFSIKNFRFKTIYNGIDTNAFKIENRENSNNLDILYFGTLVRKKGVISLAHIFNELHLRNPLAKLILIGKDSVDFLEKTSTWEVMKTILSPSALNQIVYKGVIPYEKMSAEIAKCAVCVFPSYAEAFPISWLEAMAMQKPIVASSIGWAKESIKNKHSGLLEHPENYIEFAKKINKLLTDKELASELGVNARKRVLHLFDQDKLVKENINMYKQVLSNE
ncbi:MAG: glycosyltransferase family 4 protein [Polaribacter sp.]